MPAHASELNPSNVRTVVAEEALVVAVLGALVVVLAVAEVEELLEVALAGRLERTGSVVYTADNPVTLIQIGGAGMLPATKFTAAHLEKVSQCCRYTHWMGQYTW
jgi:hypothetical protein